MTRLTTAGGIGYTLMQGYPKITGDDTKTSSTEQYKIRSIDAAAFHAESLPPPIFFLNFVILPPRRRMPGTTFMVTKSISYEPFSGELPADPLQFDPSAPAKTYDPFMKATISYETMKESDEERDESDPITFLEHSVSAGGEFLSIPPNKIKTQDIDVDGSTSTAAKDNRDMTLPAIKMVPTIEHSLKWKYALDPDWDTIIKSLGKVDNAKRDIFFDAPGECVLFTGVSGSQVYTWSGTSARVQPWNLDFKFTAKQISENNKTYGWNWAFSNDVGKWVKLQRAGGLPLYEATDLSDLFKR